MLFAISKTAEDKLISIDGISCLENSSKFLLATSLKTVSKTYKNGYDLLLIDVNSAKIFYS